MWVVPGPHSKVATVKDVHMQREWVMENQEKSTHEWILSRFSLEFSDKGHSGTLAMTRRGCDDSDGARRQHHLNPGGFRGREVQI